MTSRYDAVHGNELASMRCTVQAFVLPFQQERDIFVIRHVIVAVVLDF